jgi:hypothetical protein
MQPSLSLRKYTNTIAKVLLLAFIFSACSSPTKKKRAQHLKSKSLTKYEEKKKRRKKVKRKRNNRQITKKDAVKELRIKRENQREKALRIARQREITRNNCFEAYDKVISPIIDLKNISRKSEILPPYSYVVSYRKNDCTKSSIAKQMLKNVNYIKQRHSNRIGLLVPTIGTNSFIGKEIIAGARAACSENKCNFDEKIISRNSHGDLNQIKRSIADLLFDFNVSLIVGGTNQTEIAYLETLSDALEIPVLILNSQHEILDQKHFFKVSPSSGFMAKQILTTMKSAGKTKLAILQPSGYSNNLTNSIRTHAKEYGVFITKDFKYSPNNFESMKLAASRLLELSGKNRHSELAQLVSQKRAEAVEEGIEFNPERVSLPAIQNFDMVLIPDNFKVVRHFLKLFKFNGIEKINLIGNHLWRSPAIIEPWDPLLNDALFSDFVGNYKNLPGSLGVRIGGRGIFVNPDKMASIDFRLLGYRSTHIGLQVDNFPDQRRFKFGSQLSDMYHKDAFFQNNKVFTKDKQAHWPTFMFKINNANVRLSKSH